MLSHARYAARSSPRYASLSDNERNEMRELVLRVVSVRLYDSLLPPVVPPLRDETFAMYRGSMKLTVTWLGSQLGETFCCLRY